MTPSESHSDPTASQRLFGAVYLLEPEYSREEIARDVRNMAESGFNLITLWPVANSWLAEDPAAFVFDDTLRFLDLCHSHGMKVLLQLIGQNPAQEYAPDCLLRDELLIRSSPHNIFVNYNHPEVRQMVLRYFDACVGALKDHPAVFGWDLFNETNFRNEGKHATACYQAWLEKRYGTIGKLNSRWQRRLASFGQIDPEWRLMCYSAWSSLLPAVEYETFQAANLTEICREWCAHVRRLDPGHPVIIDGTAAQLLQPSLTERNTDEFEMAGVCDIYGGTFYPKSWGMALGNKPWELMLYYGIPRAAAERAGKPYFISELQTHTQSLLTPGSEISPQELRLFIWAALAAGGDAIQLWRWRPFLRGCQSSGRGLTSLDGAPGERAHEVAALVKSLRRHAPRLESSRPVPPDVRILLSYRSRLFFDAFRYWGPSAHPAEVCGWHRVFTALGVAVEAGSIEHLDEEYLKTPVIVLPALISLDEEQVRWLEAYVRNGGCLIADARLNAVDSWGNVRKEGPPGSVLSEVFGVVENDVGPASTFRWEDVELQASFMTQQVRVSPGAKVLAADPRAFPMVISHRYGLGQTLYFACMPGMEWKENPPAGLAELLRSHLPLAAEHVVKKPESSIVRWHRGPEGELAYVMNFGAGEALVQFAPRGGCSARELMCGDDVPSEGLSVPPAGVRLVEWRTGT